MLSPSSRTLTDVSAASAARVAAALIATLLLTSGCAAVPDVPRPPYPSPFGQDISSIYVPGIAGVGREDRGWVAGLRAGGYDGKIEFWDWTGRLDPIAALWAHGRQREQAQLVANRICQLHIASPDAPIILVAHSAGSGVAVKSLEDLPPDVQVEGLVLLAPALSRTYDLTAALRHVRGRADVFYSDRDTLVLAIGTFIFGTVDGVHGESAGHGGFVRPLGGAADAYAKIRTHPYSIARRSLGDDGGHEGVLAPRLAAGLVDPLLPGFALPESRRSLRSVDTTVTELRPPGAPPLYADLVSRRISNRKRQGSGSVPTLVRVAVADLSNAALIDMVAESDDPVLLKAASAELARRLAEPNTDKPLFIQVAKAEPDPITRCELEGRIEVEFEPSAPERQDRREAA